SGLNGTVRSLVEEFKGFETAGKALDDSINILIKHYMSPSDSIIDEMKAHRGELRNGLICAVNNIHERTLYEIGKENGIEDVDDDLLLNPYCFLTEFSNVFYMNYDLLAYWVFSSQNFKGVVDGFGYPDDSGFLKPSTVDQEDKTLLCFPHGSLMLFGFDSDVVKVKPGAVCAGFLKKELERENTDIARELLACIPETVKGKKDMRLQALVKGFIACGDYPVFISEGTSEEKEFVIANNGYLTEVCERINELAGAVFVYGCAMANDQHILRRILESKADTLFICMRDLGDEVAIADYRRYISAAQNVVKLKFKGRRSKLIVKFV